MQQIVEWLVYIEDWASRIYEEVLPAFEKDTSLHEFITELATDEAMHFHFMNSALLCLKDNPDIKAEIVLDRETTGHIETLLGKIETLVSSRNFDHADVLEAVMEAEQSEWNHIFLYVIHALKETCPHFKTIGPSIQNHLRHIEKYLAAIPDGAKLLKKIQAFAPVWEEKILIVDDYEPILDLLSSILSRDGMVDIARNGAEALEMATSNYYAVIISDIDMPIMNGIDFYERLKIAHPNVGNRFIFTSGAKNKDRFELFKKENLSFMAKPFSLMDIRREVQKVLDRNTF